MTYEPYANDAESRIRDVHSITQIVTVIPKDGEPFVLDVESCSVSFDEGWLPSITATIGARAPIDQETLNLMDPRKGCRVRIEAGYFYGGNIEDVHLLADLMLRSRNVNRPDNRISLVAASDDARAVDYRYLEGFEPNATGIKELVTSVVPTCMAPEVPVIVSDFPSNYGTDALVGMLVERGATGADVLADAMNRTETGLRVLSDRTWKIVERAEIGESKMLFTIGEGGTLEGSSTQLNREPWYNCVQIAYKWNDGTGEQVIYGTARILNGPYGINTVGHKTYVEERNIGITQSQADNAAIALLKNLSSRGRSVSVTSVNAYWLRPGDTVTIQLPLGLPEMHLVKTIEYNLLSGTMEIETRLPETVTITGGA